MSIPNPGDESRKLRSSFLILSVILAVTIVVLIIIAVVDREWPEWTGFGRAIEKIDNGQGQIVIEYQPRKTLWDLLELLIVPAFLAGGAYWLQQSGKRREQYIQEQQSQETTLQSYLDRITDLLIKEHVLDGQSPDTERAAVRSRTLTTLRMLDGIRKGIVVRFLYESNLVNIGNPFVDLNEANLNHIRLTRADLHDIDLHAAKLQHGDLSETNLTNANLYGTDLENANLAGSILHGINLRSANLSRANLLRANFHVGELTDEERTQLPPEFVLQRPLEIAGQLVEQMVSIIDNTDEKRNRISRDDHKKKIKNLKEELAKLKRHEEAWIREARDPVIQQSDEIIERLVSGALDREMDEIRRQSDEWDERAKRDDRELSAVNYDLMREIIELERKIKQEELKLATYVRADLRGASLEGANLHSANLRWADLRGAKLKDANLREAVLIHTNMSEADLENADLTNAILVRAVVSEAQLTKAKSTLGAWLDGKRLDRHIHS